MNGVLRSIAVVAAAFAALRASPPDLDVAIAKFWSAKNPADAAKAGDDIVRSGAAFDDVYARLKQGRPYSRAVPTGVIRGKRASFGGELPYTLDVPAAYDPSHAYPVRIQLHGGVMRDDPTGRGADGIGRLAGAEQIYVLPVAWKDAPWWTDLQIENLRALVDTVKRTYNVDENRVVVSGVSDGGTGTYYVAMRDTTPYAAFLPLNGSLIVLSNDDLGVHGDLSPNNLRNKPFFIVNGGNDPLYPTRAVEPYVRHLANGGVPIVYEPQPQAGHDTSWWPSLKDDFERFAAEHPRSPLPDRVSWETSDVRTSNRAHWLVIDALGGDSGKEWSPDDLNLFSPPMQLELGVRMNGTRVERIIGGSNFDRIGLRAGDVIEQVGSSRIASAAEFLDALQRYAPESTIVVTVLRAARRLELSGRFAPEEVRRPAAPIFKHHGRPGRVDLKRTGNDIEVTLRGVSELTLLLSPDQFDFTRAFRVTVNGRAVFEGRQERSVAALMKWAARDNDRTMLFGAEVRLRIR